MGLLWKLIVLLTLLSFTSGSAVHQSLDPKVNLTLTPLDLSSKKELKTGAKHNELTFISETDGKRSQQGLAETPSVSQDSETFGIREDANENFEARNSPSDHGLSKSVGNLKELNGEGLETAKTHENGVAENKDPYNKNIILKEERRLEKAADQGDAEMSLASRMDHLDKYLTRTRTAPDFAVTNGCCKVTNTTANCSRCSLTSVPKDLDHDIKCLILSYNSINSDALTTGPFRNYSNLTHLLLDSNRITFLPDEAFEGLEKLVVLNLHDNQITYNETLQMSRAFHPLNNTLKFLSLNRNCNGSSNEEQLEYPDQALSGLRRLSSLYIDGLLDTEFGEGFGYLDNLINLTLAGFEEGYCNMTSLTNNTFRYLTNLQYLNISDCNLLGSSVDYRTFAPLDHLIQLDVSNNFYLGIEAVGDFMYGLTNKTNFTHLKMQRIVKRFASCIVVYNHTLRHFSNSNLELIEAMDNEIEMIDQDALLLLPKSLTFLNATNNRIQFGAYWQNMGQLTNLENLHLDGYMRPVMFPVGFPSNNLHCQGSQMLEAVNNVENQRAKKYSTCNGDTCLHQEDELILPVPPKLRTFTMLSYPLAYMITNLSFSPNNQLENVDLSSNMFPNLTGPISGLNNLTNLTLASSFIQNIGDKFFDSFPSLEHLNLFQNLLGDCLGEDYDGKVFDNMPRLKYLNISFNNIFKLFQNTFHNLSSLEILDLSTNRLDRVDFKIDVMNNLTLLDLHNNNIGSLPTDVRNHIEQIKNRTAIRVDMSRNPIHCGCQNLEFLEWVVRTNVFGDNYTRYYCSYEEENKHTKEMKNGYHKEVARLRRQCASNVGLFFGVIGGTLLILASMAGLLVYRFRFPLRYWYHAAKLKFSTSPQRNDEEFEDDVFVSYANEDEDFILQELYPQLHDNQGLKLLIHGERFQAGRFITDNIFMAVRHSRKTLVLITRHMLNSHWCTFEMQMARQESVRRGRDVLVFLFREEISPSNMPFEVVNYIQSSTYVTYPNDPRYRGAFWDKLARDLKAG